MFNICSYMFNIIYVQFFKANELITLIVDDMHKSTINYTRLNKQKKLLLFSIM